MRYVAAYLLAALGGKTSPSVSDLEKILSSVGIEAESERINKIISELNGKDLEELIQEGSKKLASVPSGGAAAPAAGAAPAAEEASEKKEEAKAEETDSEDDDMGFGLFD